MYFSSIEFCFWVTKEKNSNCVTKKQLYDDIINSDNMLFFNWIVFYIDQWGGTI